MFKNKLTRKIVIAYFLIATPIISYAGGFFITRKVSDWKAESITSQSQLEQKLTDEKTLLDCKKKISASLEELPKGLYGTKGVSGILEEGKYHITLRKSDANTSTLKHELYHICDGHVDEKKEKGHSEINYMLFWEPQAELYSAFGWRF